jgi:hypothetical protein
MSSASPLKRKTFLVDERAVRRARKALGASSDAEAIRMSVERIAEMEEFWKLMRSTRKSVPPGSIDQP